MNQTSLFWGLPDDIGLTCLARVPRRYHTLLKCVSRRWRDLIHSEEWHAYRKKHFLAETWIYALCQDKFQQVHCYVIDPTSSKRCWKRIQVIPPRCAKRTGMGFETVGKKLYLLGGCRWLEEASDEVYCYDAAMNTWSEVAPLSTPRCFFACEALDEMLYAIGGICMKSNDAHSWDTYDPCTNKWTFHSDRHVLTESASSITMNGNIYIRGWISAVYSPVCAVVYESSTATWQQVSSDMVSGWLGPGVVVDGTLYVLDQTSGTRLMMWHKESGSWVPVGRLSALLTRPPCQVVAIGKSVFVVGKGLSTVVFDLNSAANADGVIVTSSIPRLDFDDDYSVISCKCLAI